VGTERVISKNTSEVITTPEVFFSGGFPMQLFSYACVKKLDKQKEKKMNDTKILYRSKSNRMIAGVCAGLGDYLNIDPTIIRLLFVLGFFTFNGAMLLVYLIMAIVTPEG
jgi:phage shock protein PspC (stress-responsive transcriptional regulator)